MRIILIAGAYLLLAGGKYAIAQSAGNILDSKKQAPVGFGISSEQRIEAQNLFVQYGTKYRNSGADGRKVLDGVYALGLAKTADNVNSVRVLLSSKVVDEEKVALVRILGGLYTFENSTGLNNVIAQDLRGLVHASQKDVARAAILAYSRLGYFPDSSDLLLYAKNAELIDINEYYGELAHMVKSAPPDEQINIASKIKNGRNEYATGILAFITQDEDTINKLYPETRKLILSSLEENEPRFEQATGNFSLIDSVRYAIWLQSVANLTSVTTNVRSTDFILNRLNDKRTDPRKVMAFLAAPEGKKLVKDLNQSSLFENARNRISVYAAQHPQNDTMREIVQDIAGVLKSTQQ